MENLWDCIGNLSLKKAKELLDAETVPTAATAETVHVLVHTAIEIDTLNLHWEERSRFGGAVFRGQLSSQREGEN